jgi:ribosomal protein L16 Arg81 hydroxylase
MRAIRRTGPTIGVTPTGDNAVTLPAAGADGRAAAADMYRWLIAPITAEEFQARFYERAVCVVRRGQPSYFDSLLTIDHLDRVLTTGLARHPEITLVQNEKTITSNEYVDDSGRVDPVRATRLFRQGATIVFTHLHQRIPSLGRLCEALERAFSSRMQTNIYLTPPAAQGFAPHWDTHDVFILQIAGTKHWTIYDTRIALPLQNQHFDRTVDSTGPITMEFTLEPGDVCYIPRGAIHAARSSDDTSLHITTGLLAFTWTDLLLQAVVAAGMSDVALRQNLPIGWPELADDGGLAREYRARVEKLVAHITGHPPPFPLLADSLTADYHSLSSGLLSRAIESNRLTLASIVRMRDDAESQPAADDRCTIRCSTKELEMPLAVLPALQYLEQHKPCAIGALPDVLDDDSKLVLVRRLMAEGIVDALS